MDVELGILEPLKSQSPKPRPKPKPMCVACGSLDELKGIFEGYFPFPILGIPTMIMIIKKEENRNG